MGSEMCIRDSALLVRAHMRAADAADEAAAAGAASGADEVDAGPAPGVITFAPLAPSSDGAAASLELSASGCSPCGVVERGALLLNAHRAHSVGRGGGGREGGRAEARADSLGESDGSDDEELGALLVCARGGAYALRAQPDERSPAARAWARLHAEAEAVAGGAGRGEREPASDAHAEAALVLELGGAPSPRAVPTGSWPVAARAEPERASADATTAMVARDAAALVGELSEDGARSFAR